MIGGHALGGNHDDDSSDLAIDFTPLLDVIFILLAFFILTANSVEQALEVALPKVASEATALIAPTERVTVLLRQEAPHWQVDGRVIARHADLAEALGTARSLRPEAELIIQADRNAPVEPLLQLLGELREQAWPVAQLLTRSGEANPTH